MKVSGILNNIELGSLALPEFQRGYVWTRTQVRGLMQSLYRRYPVGGVLVWVTDGGAADTRGTSAEAGRVIELLLDGQQRMTSLYGVIRGHAPVFFQGDPKAFTDLYFDLRTETFEFYGPVKMRDDPFWVNVTDLFKTGLGPFFTMAAELGLDAETQSLYLQRLNAITTIQDIDFHVERITGDKEVDEVVDIFNRVNSGGTKLSKGDLALAQICGRWPQGRTELHRLTSKWAEAGFHFDLEWLLRCATAVSTNQASYGALRSISVDGFADALKRTERAVDFLLNLVSSRLGLDHDRVLGGRYAFTALTRLVDQAGGQITDPVEQGKILYWYVNSFLWGRYSSSTETVLARDLEAMGKGGIDGLTQELERSRGSLTVRPGDFDSSSRGARFYAMIYLLSRVGGARDLVTGLPLSASMLGSGNRLELHHIIPKKLTKEAGFESSDRNAIANFCFLTGSSNRKIAASEPASYLAELEGQNPGVLTSQWIPQDPSLWKIDRYPDFLEARRSLLADAANDLLNGLLVSASLGSPLAPGGLAETRFSGAAEPDELIELTQKMGEFGLAAPSLNYEFIDEVSGELLASADAVWPKGMQPGLTEKVALLLESDDEMETRLGELGYRFFTSTQRLDWYIEELLGIDLDGDGEIGQPKKPSESELLEETRLPGEVVLEPSLETTQSRFGSSPGAGVAATDDASASSSQWFVATLSKSLASNWSICKEHSLWGVGTSPNGQKAARVIQPGDRIAVWLSGGSGIIAVAEATETARVPGSLAEVPWPDPGRYSYIFGIRTLVELPSGVPDSMIDYRTVRFGIKTNDLQNGFARLDASYYSELEALL